ncbi:cation diffusion facilitator family transporter [Sphingosinicellaceae bacterium]|nr:cation diffusion facilitator family transporter [Sphingosinicellaceae bacterium]
MADHDHHHGAAAHDHGAVAHGHGHSHSHGHSHAPANFDRAFAIGVVLNLGFVLAEAGYGVASGSLALLADAGHNAADVLSLLLAWGAAWASRRQPTANFTYGFRRSSIMASTINAVVLLMAVAIIVVEAVQRLANPEPVATDTVMAVAALGIAVNGITAWLFASGRKDDLNVRGAFQHMAADALVSAGVVVAAFVMSRTGWLWLDPAVAIGVALIIAAASWGTLRESLRLSLDAVPEGVDCAAVEAYLLELPGVVAVHDMHIWSMSTTEVALTVHLTVPGIGPHDSLLAKLAHDLSHHHRIAHPTVQIEADHSTCALEPAERV